MRKTQNGTSLVFGLAWNVAKGKYTREQPHRHFIFYEVVFVKKGLCNEMDW